MQEHAQNGITISEFIDTLPKEQRDKIIKDAWKQYRAQKSSPESKQFMRVLRRRPWPPLDGFSQPTKSPAFYQILLQYFDFPENTDNELFHSLLDVWITIYSDLIEVARSFLVVQESTDNFESLSLQFCSSNPSIENSEAILLLRHLAQPSVDHQEEQDMAGYPEEENDQSGSPRFLRWLEELESLPIDSPDWQYVPWFIDAVQKIVDERLKEQQILVSKHEDLRESLQTLQQVCDPYFEYHGIMRILDWRVIPEWLDDQSELDNLVNQLNLLHITILNHDRILSVQPANRTERQSRDEQLHRLEEEIAQLYLILVSKFSESDPHDLPDTNLLDEEIVATNVISLSQDNETQNPTFFDLMSQEVDDPVFVDKDSPPEVIQEAENVDLVEAYPSIDFSLDTYLEADSIEELGFESDLLVDDGGLSVDDDNISEINYQSSQTIAIALKQQDSEILWKQLVWALIAEDDLPGAYWLSQGLEQTREILTAPDWLIAAAQGSRWLTTQSPAFVGDLLEIAKHDSPDTEETYIILGLAAALRSTLIAPASGLIDWLRNRPESYPELYGLLEAVLDFAGQGCVLLSEEINEVGGKEENNERITEIQQQAEKWLDDAFHKRTNYDTATKVWRRMVGPRGRIRTLLTSVIQNEQAEINIVRDQISTLLRDDSYIEDAQKQLNISHNQRIVGEARKQLIRNTSEACRLASQWCDLVEHAWRMDQHGVRWLSQQVGNLRRAVSNILPEVYQSLNQTIADGKGYNLVGSVYCLRRAIDQLCFTLNLPIEVQIPEDYFNQIGLFTTDTTDLNMALSRRLLWFPNLGDVLDNDGVPIRLLDNLVEEIRDACAENRTLYMAFNGWLSLKDFRFAERLLAAMEHKPELSQQLHTSLEGAKVGLRDRAQKIADEVEDALLNGVLSEDGRSHYSGDVSGIIDDPSLNFRDKETRLNLIHQEMMSQRNIRCSELQSIWGKEISPRLDQYITDDEVRIRISDLISGKIESGDTRIVDEYLAQLRKVVEGSEPFQENLFSGADARDPLVEFIGSPKSSDEAKADLIEHWVLRKRNGDLHSIAEEIRSGRTVADIKFGGITGARREEAYNAIENWKYLRNSEPRRFGVEMQWHERICIVMQYLGFNVDNSHRLAPKIGTDWVYSQIVTKSIPYTRPIPQFGSQAEHVYKGEASERCYHVVCFWQRPGPGTIAERLAELDLDRRHNVIIFYLGVFTRTQRIELLRRRNKAVILDETLLIFLAQERDAANRLSTFLRCALPYADLNPYMPRAGDVPPEMFFGREDVIREMAQPSGGYVLYGGRQMGKTALLRQVQRLFHNPERQQYALYLDIKPIGSDQDTTTIWHRVRDGLREIELLTAAEARTDDDEQIEKYVRRILRERSGSRIFILFDEADNFLDADSGTLRILEGNSYKTPFPVLEKLRTLMIETDRRFLMAFAGLHNVQRFQNIPNQPLAHFSRPISIGPLEPRDAEKLVREPLEYLGFRLADASVIWRVLSYTNYHPGLIQIFCDELVKMMRDRAGNTRLPLVIDQSDVDAVYRTQKVRESIRDRFNWTLALDMRYQAIAWTLIFDQVNVSDSYARTYSPAQILELVREYWPNGFDNLDSDKLRGLLDEMCGLGVLVNDRSSGGYRLRSPNLVRLIGTEDYVQDKLVELRDKQPPVSFRLDTHHAPLDNNALDYSSLTYAQERDLNQAQPGVVLIFSSPAVGLASLPKTFANLVPDKLGIVDEIPPTLKTGDDLLTWLSNYYDQRAPHYDRLIVYQSPRFIMSQSGTHPGTLRSLVQAALKFRDKIQNKRKTMQIFFVFDPETAWNWLLLDDQIRENLEMRVDAVIKVGRWGRESIAKRLDQHNIPFPDAFLDTLQNVTNGWPILLDEFFKRYYTDVHQPPENVANVLCQNFANQTDLRQNFWDALGIQEPIVLQVLTTIWHFQPVEREDFISSGMIENVSQHLLQSALEYLIRFGCLEISHIESENLCVNPIVETVLKTIWQSH